MVHHRHFRCDMESYVRHHFRCDIESHTAIISGATSNRTPPSFPVRYQIAHRRHFRCGIESHTAGIYGAILDCTPPSFLVQYWILYGIGHRNCLNFGWGWDRTQSHVCHHKNLYHWAYGQNLWGAITQGLHVKATKITLTFLKSVIFLQFFWTVRSKRTIIFTKLVFHPASF